MEIFQWSPGDKLSTQMMPKGK